MGNKKKHCKLSTCRKRSSKYMNEVLRKRRCMTKNNEGANEILRVNTPSTDLPEESMQYDQNRVNAPTTDIPEGTMQHDETTTKTYTELRNVGETSLHLEVQNETPKDLPTVEIHCDRSTKTYTELRNVGETSSHLEVQYETPKDLQTVEIHCDRSTLANTEDRCQQQQQEFEIETGGCSTKDDLHLVGRRIVSINFFLENLKKISMHSQAFGCGLQNLVLVSEKKSGLKSKLKFTCNMCNDTFFVDTNERDIKLDLNKAAISGVVSTGIGFSQFEELCTSMDLPSLNQKHFDRLHDEVCDEWQKTAVDLMVAAGKRERDAAIERGDVTKDGIPYIDVIADGCWSKRSYKTNYSALSGAAAIIGRTFGEVLFIGVKNKYCSVCARAQNKNEIPGTHRCFKNYSGSSTGMESDILLEGFKQSIETHGLIYARMVADGDSSTFKKISEARVYPNFSVEKIECRNHVFRNMCAKLKAVSTDLKFPLQLRKKITTERILAVRKVICCAIKEHKNADCNRNQKITNLYTDITNSIFHAFGNHSFCKDYYCQSSRMSEDLTLLLKTSAIWFRIKTIVTSVAAKSRSLICDVDSNRVECFNSIVAKFVGGKRVNFSLKRGYQARCDAAVVSFNSKKPLYTLHKSILGKSPMRLKGLETRRANRLSQKKKGKRRLIFQKNSDQQYGESCVQPDMPDDVLSKCKEQFLKDLHKTNEEIQAIERNTVLQRDSSEWLEVRRNLITASNFAKVVKRKQTTKAKNLVKDIIYKRDISHVASVQHGIAHEKIALEQLERQIGQEIRPCGLFIDPELPFLGATPDGLIGGDTIVEIKCPFSAYKSSLEEAIASGKVNFWKKPKPRDVLLTVNENHPWFIQIQGQMHVTRRTKCIFAVWSGVEQDLKVETICRDDTFWETKMKDKLVSFYKNHLLVELCDPRHTRNMPIRD